MTKVSAANPIFRDKRRRAWELDFLRGIAVIAMCFDHAMFDFTALSGWFSNYWQVKNPVITNIVDFAKTYWGTTGTYGFRFWAHYAFVFLFLFLVGTSCAFSRDNTRRGALCGVAAIAFTGISYVCKAWGFMQRGVVFGILHCIALSILCAASLDSLTNINAWFDQNKPMTKKRKAAMTFGKYLNLYAPLVVGFIITLFGILGKFWLVYSDGYDGEFVNEHFLGYVFGTNCFGDDWFGLYPYVGMVLIGMYWGRAAYSKRRETLLPLLDRAWHKPVTFVGRHALWFYFFHQPVIAGIIMAVGLALGYAM